ncbi:band 4.1-like protein 2 isoform X3 [Brienomyrus brachyistius]|uniref:band 4.1-like protein 2 isoform X3 n=1 Tax=Brienomyrus brachyistius TaxID=42636 RepID=UPI0020B33613|nr:band 4.1-like protein 2 isoform X3 [Brienomyrus brachyistius]
MTTEVASETEVKKEPEKADEQPVAAQQQDGEEEPEQLAAVQDGVTPRAASPHADRKSKEAKGLSRFLPPWLKRQKSLSRTEPSEDREDKTPTEEQQEAPPSEEASPQEAERDESHSIGSADTQPAKEEKGEGSPERIGDGKEEEDLLESKAGEKDEGKLLKLEAEVEKSSLKPAKKMKTVTCQVTLLDGSLLPCELEKRVRGIVLFAKVCEHLNLLEKDYFGLCYKDHADQKCWLDPAKEIKRQIRNCPWQFAFSVKFYPPDPSQLTEDITRYLLCLQLRQDIASGRLPCSFVTHSLLGSYTLQAEMGDHDPDGHCLDYISDFQFAPSQSKEMEEKVVELYKTHRGMSPAQADAQFLENAKKLSMYGVDLHHAKDSEGVDIMLGVCANGLLIYKDRLRINRFAWPKILKISYKRSNFYIKIRPGEAEQFESSVGFKLPNHRAAKRLWKVCVEHHTFFRLVTPEQPPKARFLTLGSKFRYSGRTQAQTREASTLIDRPAPHFERCSSKRLSRSLDGAPGLGMDDQSGAPGQGLTPGAKNGRDPALELSSDSKSKLRVQGENIYVRHSNLMLEDLDKTQEDVLKHQASISELKRNFMESTPEPQPSQWEKRLTASPATSLRLRAQAAFEEEVPSSSVLSSPVAVPTGLPAACTTSVSAAEGDIAVGSPPAAAHVVETAEDKQKSDTLEQAEVEIEETVVIKEVRKAPKVEVTVPEVVVTIAVTEKEPEEKTGAEAEGRGDEGVTQRGSTSSDSHSESEDEAEYRPQAPGESIDHIKEVPEEEEELAVEAQPLEAEPAAAPPCPTTEEQESPLKDEAQNGHPEMQSPQGSVEEDEEDEGEPKLNGDASRAETEGLPQVICCSEPPVVKTEMVTISDTFAAQKTEISTTEVPIVHTETKTITYEAAQVDGAGDGEPGVLMTAQTITSESLCTTTTTHITKTLKGGVSETRIEKRIVISGDSDIDHDQALARAIKEAKEQHPDMSVTRVVVHKETEVMEEGKD